MIHTIYVWYNTGLDTWLSDSPENCLSLHAKSEKFNNGEYFYDKMILLYFGIYLNGVFSVV